MPVQAVPRDLEPDLVEPAAPDSYVLGAGDLLSVFVYQMPEFTRQARVTDSGRVQLPFLKTAFDAAGRTAPQLAGAIAAELDREGLARSAQVQVTVRQVLSKPIVVSGAVRQPMVIQASQPMTLLEVIARAGGFNDDQSKQPAGDFILVSERNASAAITTRVPVQSLLAGVAEDTPTAAGAATKSARGAAMVLAGNDTVTVLPARMVYTVGALQQPGAFPLRAAEPVSVLKAISLSQGFSKQKPADRGHSEIIRTAPDGSRHELVVNLDKVLKHKSPDLVLQAGDILYVPEDGKRQVLGQILGDIGQAATLTVAYHPP